MLRPIPAAASFTFSDRVEYMRTLEALADAPRYVARIMYSMHERQCEAWTEHYAKWPTSYPDRAKHHAVLALSMHHRRRE